MKVLDIKDLMITIGNKVIVKNASFNVNEGDVLLLTGSNGSGKSTLIKVLVGDVFDYSKSLKVAASSMLFNDGESTLDLKENEKYRESFRKKVCYVSQEDEFESDSVLDCFLSSIDHLDLDNPVLYVLEFVCKYKIYECFGIVDAVKGVKNGKVLKRAGLRRKTITPELVMASQYLSMSIRRMSGGQRKLTNIFSILIKSDYVQLILMDEPLNNLDYDNVRKFSNILTMIHNDHPKISIVLVTHCRSIPIINRVIEIDTITKELFEGELYKCNSCFGKIDNNGMYI